MTARMRRLVLLAASLPASLGLAACASQRPVLYPNAQLQRVGPAAAEEDVTFCLAAAEQWVKAPSRTAKTAGQTATGAAGGAAVGGAVGAVVGHAGRGAAAGAAGGATRGLLRGAFRRGPDPVERRYVEQCLRDRGYQTIGWR